ncbi:MAG: pilus assembly protein PilP [Piscirickettsiaceae bacterium]|nr:MAG: pilus assembly protein PilP [Piscirickettsiaceae bacterium]
MKFKYIRQPSWVLIASIMMVCATGCVNEEFDDLEAYVAKVKMKKADPIEPLPVIKAYESFTYAADDLRNPFEPVQEPLVIAEVEEGTGPGPDLARAKEELEGYPLDTLRMVGTLEKGGQLWGLVRANDGVIHRVQPGNYLGQNFGKINEISEVQINVDEFITTSGGRWRERQASLALAE